MNVVENELLLREIVRNVDPRLAIGCPQYLLRIVLQGFMSSERPKVYRSLTVKIHVSAPVSIFMLTARLALTLTGV